MAIDGVAVKFGADTGELTAAMTKLTSDMDACFTGLTKRMDEFTTQSKQTSTETSSALGTVKEAVESVSKAFESLMLPLAAVGAILAGGSMFKEAVKGMMDTALEADHLHRVLGITTEEASVLNVGLKLVGISADEFVGIANKLTRAVHGNSEAFRELGMRTTDVHGVTLPLVDLIDNASKKMMEYREGFDRDSVAMTLFGRNAEGAMAVLRLNNEVKARANQLAQDYGLVQGPAEIATVREYQMEMRANGLVLDSINDQIGKALMPTLLQLSKWYSDIGPPAVKGFSSALLALGHGAVEFSAIAKLAWNEAGIWLVFYGRELKALASLDFTGMNNALEDALNQQKMAIFAFHSTMKTENDKFASEMDGIWDNSKKPKTNENDPDKGGNKTVKVKAPPDPGHMADYEKELTQAKVKYETLKGLDGEYVLFTKEQEESFWVAKLATVTKGSTDAKDIQQKINQQIISINKQAFDEHIKSLKIDMDAERLSFDTKINLAKQIAQETATAYGAQSTQAQEASAKIIALEYQKSEVIKKGYLDQIQAQEKYSLTTVTTEQTRINELYSLGRLSIKTKLQDDLALEAQRYAIQMNAVNREIALLDVGTLAYQKAMDRRAQLTATEANNITKIEAKSATDSAKAWTSMTSVMQSSMQSAMVGMVYGTTTFQKGFQTVMQAVVKDMITTCAKLLSEWILNQLAQTAFGKSMLAISQGLKVTATATEIAQDKAKAMAVIPSETGIAMMAAASAVAGIPVVGPELAVTAAASMQSLGAGAMAISASAGGEWQVPNDRLNYVHKNETILPARIAEPMRKAFESGNGQGNKSHIININATDADSVKNLLINNRGALVQALKVHARYAR